MTYLYQSERVSFIIVSSVTSESIYMYSDSLISVKSIVQYEFPSRWTKNGALNGE